MTATKAAPVAMPAAEWRRALLASDLPRHARILGCQAAYYALTPEDCLVRLPSMRVLAECAELPHRDVVDALALLRRTGWITQVRDPEHTDDRPITCLTDPPAGAR